MRLLIFGYGGMGKLFRDFFESRGYKVSSYDIDKRKSDVDLSEIENFDVIFLCVPMDSIEEAVNEIAKRTKKPLVVDISTLKSYSIPHLRKAGLDFLSIHPMFGPDSEIGLSNIIIVERSGREEEEIILNEFKKAGAVLSQIDPEFHDKKMAEIQGVAHFLLILFAYYLRDKFKDEFNYASPIFLVMHKLASRILNQDWRLYYFIQKNAEELRRELIEHARELDKLIKDEKSFNDLFKELKNVFRICQDSTLILEACKVTVNPKGIDMLRGFIRVIDSLILKLIDKRVKAGREVAKHKRIINEPIEIAQVESVKINELIRKTNLNPIIVSDVFEKIMDITKEEEYKILGIKKKVGVLGPAGSFSEEVALKLIGSRLPLIYFNTVEEIFSAVESGHIDYGIVPIENSVYGSVLATLDALLSYNVEVFGEYETLVRHNLVSKKPLDLKEIRVIYSHPQAIAQCSEFINNYLPQAEIRYTRSTSDAINMLDDKSAAIASELAARLYKLHILRRDIQDNPNNKTRFYIIRKKEKRTTVDGNITSLFFGVSDRPGALYKVLEVFYERNINLRKLESRPAKTSLGDYVFFTEAEEKLDDETVEEIRKRTTFCKVVGVFKKLDKLDVFS
uniref:Prephenate dehydrogenase n=1 Tax=Geoglobus ahangari TaxID=113653 RepID=A0A7J3TJE1_9EURY